MALTGCPGTEGDEPTPGLSPTPSLTALPGDDDTEPASPTPPLADTPTPPPGATPTASPQDTPTAPPGHTPTLPPTANQAPTFRWDTPADGLVQEVGASTAFSMTVSDDDPVTRLQVQVTSSLAGSLFSGAPSSSGLVSFSKNLSSGTHRLTTQVTDREGLSSLETRTLILDAAPSLTLLEPATGDTFPLGQAIPLRATVTDPDEALTGLLLTVESNLDGLVASPGVPATGEVEASLLGLTTGQHRLKVDVVDGHGLGDSASVTIVVDACLADDQDQDGFGVGSSCTLPDCDDHSAAIYPGAVETCNGVDDDCDQDIDDGVLSSYYPDKDGDGYGALSEVMLACSVSDGYVSNTTDCNDSSNTIHPGALEVCDGVDQDCDGWIDDGVERLWHKDDDKDGYGSPTGTTTVACLQPAGFSPFASDCNDHDSSVYPGAIDSYGDARDLDCDGLDGLVQASRTLSLDAASARLRGEAYSIYLGSSVAPAGDMNGDGNDDLLVTAPGEDSGGTQAGAIYLISGPVRGDLELSKATVTAKLLGESAKDNASEAVGVGDVNGDGMDDILISARDYDRGSVTSAGAVYLFYGPVSGELSLGEADMKWEGIDVDGLGTRLTPAGDMNQDGYADFAVSAPYRAENGRAYAGVVYLIYGGKGLSGVASISTAPVRFVGSAASEYLGTSLSGGGDINGDGLPDLLLGTSAYAYYEGGAYVVFGRKNLSGTYDLADPYNYSFRLAPLDVSWKIRDPMNLVGDVTGDGLADIALSAVHDEVSADTPSVLLVPGSAAYVGEIIVDTAAIVLEGVEVDDNARFSTLRPGDLNGDGYEDLVIGAPGYDPKQGSDNNGRIYGFYGPIPDDIDLFFPYLLLEGTGNGQAGTALSMVGDLNGDGRDELAIGGPYANANGMTDNGLVWLWYGPVVPGYNLGKAEDRLERQDWNGELGLSLASLGDLDGDLLPEVVASGDGYDHGNTLDVGAVYIFPGSLLQGGVIQANDAPFRLEGTEEGGGNVVKVASAGDADGDGVGDLLASLPESSLAGPQSGTVFLVPSPFKAEETLGSRGLILTGEAADSRAGEVIASAGDLDKDGRSELLVGARSCPSCGSSAGSAVYLVASAQGLAGMHDLSEARACYFTSSNASGLGMSVAGVGDVTGDGQADFLIGVPGENSTASAAGAAYLVTEMHSGNQLLQSSASIIRFVGEQVWDNAGYAVAGLGDVNGDGYADVATGAPGYDLSSNERESGVVYIILGGPHLGGTYSLGTVGLKLLGDTYGDGIGTVLASGDVSQDGRGDLLVGSPTEGTMQGATGLVYVLTHLSSLVASQSITEVSVRRLEAPSLVDRMGYSALMVDDLNGDGVGELFLGANIRRDAAFNYSAIFQLNSRETLAW